MRNFLIIGIVILYIEIRENVDIFKKRKIRKISVEFFKYY